MSSDAMSRCDDINDKVTSKRSTDKLHGMCGRHVVAMEEGYMSSDAANKRQKENNAVRVALLLSYLILIIGAKELKYVNKGENNNQILTSQNVIIRTIQAEDGDIYDCVDVYQQPALKHPMLRDHKIQMEPTSFPTGFDIESSSLPEVSEAQLSIIDCPIGTVPILRNNVDNMAVQHAGSTLASNGQQIQEAGIKYWDDRFIYGTQASINVYAPYVNERSKDLSASWLQICNGPKDSPAGIGAGSWVSPGLSGDSLPRFHIKWDDEFQMKSCIDYSCPGFIQDEETGSWWLSYGKGNENIGYWPDNVFHYLRHRGDYAFWGGFVQGPTVSSNPPQMGSGHFASEGYGKAAFVNNILILNGEKVVVAPDFVRALPGSSVPSKYTYYDVGVGDNGMHVLYGGPGGKR
ncbi:hypothetical protein GUJ93_ZPchr0002g22934 [Zizania palustris]|uniref:Neprosin PEP catalytic domain-containing protein n=1 Tax=Zizania palustris TaxID=103762 RepID=A0A8J5VHM6_ZIZPA|nr:hypothetical protein GUJ93_ZPchr0002g22934 [Zizania palustris]